MSAGDEYRELTDLAHRWRKRTLLEYVDEAPVKDYLTPDEALRDLLDLAWDELEDARRTAIGGVWSMKCDWRVARIIGLTRLIGPIDWGSVPVTLILDGVYERIHERAGHPTPLTDADRARAREVMERRSR
jgi:hypothetical protein